MTEEYLQKYFLKCRRARSIKKQAKTFTRYKSHIEQMLNLSLLGKRRTNTVGESVRTLGIRKPCLHRTHFCPAPLQGPSPPPPTTIQLSPCNRVELPLSSAARHTFSLRPGQEEHSLPWPVTGLGIGSDSSWGQPQSSWDIFHNCWKRHPFPTGSFELVGGDVYSHLYRCEKTCLKTRPTHRRTGVRDGAGGGAERGRADS